MKSFLQSSLLLPFLFFITASNGQQFTPIDTLPQGAYGAAAWGDFDNDNQQDLAYITQAVPFDIFKVYHNVANQFVEVTQHFPVLYNPAVKWVDFNNDGFDDLIACGMDSVFRCVVKLYQSNGNGTFNAISNSFFGLSAGSIAIADYNHDGKQDFAYTGNDSVGAHHAFIYKNNGNFNFTNINASLSGIHFGEMQFGDYNNDSLPDLIINGIADIGFHCLLYKNMGSDSFQLQPIYMKASGGTVDWVDYNNDGALDVLVTGYDSTSGTSFTELHQNNQNGTFSVVNTNLPEFGEPSAVAVADFNNDTKQDICFAGGSSGFNSSSLAMGNGSTTFSVANFFQVDILNSVVEAADIDNDGDVDLLLNNLILRNDLNVGISTISADKNRFSVFPVPASEQLTIDNGQLTIDRVSISDALGRIIYDAQPHSPLLIINCQLFPSGIYYIEIKTPNNLQVKKFSKQ